MKPRCFNISTDSYSLNVFSSSFSHLLQMIEITNGFSKVYGILSFLNFKFSVLTTKSTKDFSHIIFLISENILVLFYHFFHIRQEEINLCNLAKFFL